MNCWADAHGALQTSGAEVVSTSALITGLEEYRRYQVKVCASNGYGVAESGTVAVDTFVSVEPPSGSGLTYAVATAPATSGSHYEYGIARAPAPQLDSRFTAQYLLYGSWTESFWLSADAAPGEILVRGCRRFDSDRCSETSNITAASGSAPTIATVDVSSECRAEPQDTGNVSLDEAGVTVSAAARGSAYIAAWTVPDPALPLEVTFQIRFGGAYAPFASITRSATICTPTPPVDPPTDEPDPPVIP